MSVTTLDLVDAIMIGNGKMPDIYWNFGLSNSEMVVLRYVVDSISRIYFTLKCFPKGFDGSPRYWKDKQKMAEDCSLSYPTFRNNVRHLAEMGFVTYMDKDCNRTSDEDDIHCIGLSIDWIKKQGIKLPQVEETKKNAHAHNIYNLITTIYNKMTVDVITNTAQNYYPLFVQLRNKKLTIGEERYNNAVGEISKLYDNPTVEIIKATDDNMQIKLTEYEEPVEEIKQIVKTEEIITETKLDAKVEDLFKSFVTYPEIEERLLGSTELKNSAVEKRVPILNVKRVPITVIRTPILSSNLDNKNYEVSSTIDLKNIIRTPVFGGKILDGVSLKIIMSAFDKREELKNVITPYERHVLKLVDYYEFRCRKAIHSSGFRAIGKNFRDSRNWKFFTRIYDLCEENNWDYKIYIDAQFDRVKHWSRKQQYPFANQFTSDGAQKYYFSYLRDQKENYSVGIERKVKSQKIVSVADEIATAVVKDCTTIQSYIERAKKRRNNKDLTEEQLKLLFLSDNWMTLSAYYLSAIPWIEEWMAQFPDETFLVDLKADVKKLRSSNKMMKTTNTIVYQIEQALGVPKTL